MHDRDVELRRAYRELEEKYSPDPALVEEGRRVLAALRAAGVDLETLLDGKEG